MRATGFSVHEEVYIAALDLGDAELSARCLDVLARRFPSSFRVRTLEAMGLEAAGRFSEALGVYDKILEDDAGNTVRRALLAAVRFDRCACVRAPGRPRADPATGRQLPAPSST